MPRDFHRGWYKHGKLPHFDHPGLYQSITYRLHDSLPQFRLEELEDEFRKKKLAKSAWQIIRDRLVNNLLDEGHGACILRHSSNAKSVVDGWRYFDGQRYDLIAGVVMPNHVHVCVRIHHKTRLGDMVGSWKSYTARCFQRAMPDKRPPFWQRGYWDRFIRNEKHLEEVLQYILHNPVKAGLVESPEEWPYLVIGAEVAREGDPPDVIREVL
jgi:putative transposase